MPKRTTHDASPRPSRRLPAGAIERGVVELAAAQRNAAQRRAAETARAVQEERLRRLEADLAELRGRVNGLIFLVVGAVVTQFIVRLLE